MYVKNILMESIEISKLWLQVYNNRTYRCTNAPDAVGQCDNTEEGEYGEDFIQLYFVNPFRLLLFLIVK